MRNFPGFNMYDADFSSCPLALKLYTVRYPWNIP
jgi:hypothetical protein